MKLCYKIKMNEIEFFQIADSYTKELVGENKEIKTCIRYLGHTQDVKFVLTEEKDLRYDVSKLTMTIKNNSDRVAVLKNCNIGVIEEGENPTINYFLSDWGSEFTPQEKSLKLVDEFSYGSLSGRASKGFVPFCLAKTKNSNLAMAIAYSGNWNCTAKNLGGTFALTMGLNEEECFIDIKGKSEIVLPVVYFSKNEDSEIASLNIRSYFKNNLSIQTEEMFGEMPLVYNHWWPYEDTHINEEVFFDNAKIAASMGFKYAMLDAGWFGVNTKENAWYEKRGDWDLVNEVKFPSGIKNLFDKVKAEGILPGIWCEIEAVGEKANFNNKHDELLAKRNGHSLGYVCFGNPKAIDWAIGIMDKLIGEYGAKWVKFDFNLDPGYGCNCEEHGHGKGDGLLAHYNGYYKFLDTVRAKYPDVVLENCASGGLRNDIGMLSHTHVGFLSDPDYTDIHLQTYWGALSYLHQSACLHFSWSQIVGDHNEGITDPIYKDLEKHKFDFYIRAVLMGASGFSYRLPEMPKWTIERLKELGEFYKTISKDFIFNGDVYRLTPQPCTDKGGERFPCFQFSDKKGNNIVFAFRLLKSKDKQVVHLRNIDESKNYLISYTDKNTKEEVSGKKLIKTGLVFENMPEESSEIVKIEEIIK